MDYLYVSFTNATALSPTDTMPLSRCAKLLMLTQSGVSLITVALVIARAVNIFKWRSGGCRIPVIVARHSAADPTQPLAGRSA